MEKATTQPIEIIDEVFDQVSLSDLINDLLPNWLRVAVYNHVLCLVEAAYRLYTDQQTQRVLNTSL